MLVEPVIAHRPVVSFHISILLWLARLDVLELNALLLSPRHELATDVFRPVVTANASEFTTPLNHLIQSTFDAL